MTASQRPGAAVFFLGPLPGMVPRVVGEPVVRAQVSFAAGAAIVGAHKARDQRALGVSEGACCAP